MEEIITLDSIDNYNKVYGFETKHPLVTVVDFVNLGADKYDRSEKTYNYELYAIFLKETLCGDITYGRQPYDYQEGTVTSFAPGQTVHIKPNVNVIPRAKGLLFHPDLIRGTSLGHDIKQYNFFASSSREALHLSEDEKVIFSDCLNKIQAELDRPIDNHSKKLICRNIDLLLDYCMRFYERQFITREAVNKDVITKFEELIDKYFGDLVKKETGRNPQEYIQSKIIELAKDKLLGSEKSVSEISYELGFQYSQHFNRYFKRYVGKTPSEYRTTAV